MKKIQLGGHIKSWKTGKKEIRGWALVDDEDYEWLNKYKWNICTGYASRYLTKGESGWLPNKRIRIAMHQMLCPTREGYEVDHINRIRHDNRKKNLREVTRSVNIKNRNYRRKFQPGRGIHWHRGNKHWVVRIGVFGERVYVGSVKTLEEAKRLRKQAEAKYF